MRRLETFDIIFIHILLALMLAVMIGIRIDPSLIPAASPLLTYEDLRKPKSLVIKLRDGNDPVYRHLRQELSPTTRVLLSEYEGGVCGTPSYELKQGLVEDFNWIITNPRSCLDSLMDAEAMTAEKRELYDRALGKDGMARVNRVMLEELFPEEIAKNVSGLREWGFVDHAFYFLLLLFILKYLHEHSVLSYHMRSTMIWPPRSSRWSERGLFLSRLVFLWSLYQVIVYTYQERGGVFSVEAGEVSVLWLPVITAYVIPDMILLFSATDHKPFNLKYLLFFVFRKSGLFRRGAQIKGMDDLEKVSLHWMQLNLVSLLLIFFLLQLKLVPQFHDAWYASGLLFINIIDWVLNKNFFFGNLKESRMRGTVSGEDALVVNQEGSYRVEEVPPCDHVLECQFNWGDEHESDWSDSFEASHAWTETGPYRIRARIRSKKVPSRITVWSSPKVVNIKSA